MAFGSLGRFNSTDLTGKNVLLFLAYPEEHDGFLSRVDFLIQSRKPTRILIIAPSLIFRRPLSRGWLELAYIPFGFPLIPANDLKTY